MIAAHPEPAGLEGEEDSSKLPSAAMAMSTTQMRHWYLSYLHCILIGCLVESSSLPPSSTPVVISTLVGRQAVLPCSWKSRLSGLVLTDCHIQWQTPSETVYEQWGQQKWQAEEFQGRTEVPEEKLGAGDCSLVVNDVQFGDTGLYESFMVVEGARLKRRVFIQSVRLSVFDHKSRQSSAPGQDMVMELHTPRSVRVVFQSRNSSEWTELWMRGEENNQRLQHNPDREQLTLKRVKTTDEGMYKVLDAHGLAVSTVQLTVEEGSTALKVHQIQENEVIEGDISRSSCSSLKAVFSLIFGLLILHLV